MSVNAVFFLLLKSEVNFIQKNFFVGKESSSQDKDKSSNEEENKREVLIKMLKDHLLAEKDFQIKGIKHVSAMIFSW